MGGINGVESVIYGVEDLDLCVRYFVDFGLPLIAREGQSALFELEEGSSVIIRPLRGANGQRWRRAASFASAWRPCPAATA